MMMIVQYIVIGTRYTAATDSVKLHSHVWQSQVFIYSAVSGLIQLVIIISRMLY